MGVRFQCICVDVADPQLVADFWQSTLGWRRTLDTPAEVVLEPAAGTPQDGVSPDLLFLRVPEPKAGKNRLHIDLRPDDQAVELARVEGLGARRVGIGQQGDESWVVLADPEGNEFCILRSLTGDDVKYEGPAES